MSLGALPSRRNRPPPPVGPPPPPPPNANSSFAPPPQRNHWKSLARLEMGDMTAKNIKGSITRAFGFKSKQDKTSPSSSSESSSVVSRWSRPSPPRTRSYISIGHSSGGHPPYSSLDYDSTYESPQSIYDSPLNCNAPHLSYRVSSQQSINSNIYSNGSHCFDISELESVSHRTYSQRSVNSHRVSSPLPIHEEVDNPHKQKKHRRVKSIGDIEAASTLPA